MRGHGGTTTNDEGDFSTTVCLSPELCLPHPPPAKSCEFVNAKP